MKPHVLIIVTSDPRLSPRVAEAIRFAAGIGTWEKVEVTLYLHDSAVLALGEFTDELKDDQSISRYLPQLGESGNAVCVPENSVWLNDLGESPVRCETISTKQLARLAAGAKTVFRF